MRKKGGNGSKHCRQQRSPSAMSPQLVRPWRAPLYAGFRDVWMQTSTPAHMRSKIASCRPLLPCLLSGLTGPEMCRPRHWQKRRGWCRTPGWCLGWASKTLPRGLRLHRNSYGKKGVPSPSTTGLGREKAPPRGGRQKAPARKNGCSASGGAGTWRWVACRPRTSCQRM